MGKTYRKINTGDGAKRRIRRVEKMAKRRSKERPQLRGKHRYIKIWCKQHKWQKIPMLSPLVCPCCGVERKDPDLLLGPAPEGSDRKFPGHEHLRSMEEDGWD